MTSNVHGVVIVTIVLGTFITALALRATAEETHHTKPMKTRMIWCLDEHRSIVSRTQEWRCKGRVVSAIEADRVKLERVKRIKGVLRREREPTIPGKRLTGTGTGFFISTRGHLITNNHVIANCDAVTVAPARGGEFVARVRGADAARDLALLETDRASPGPARFRAFDEIILNETVVVIGYPEHGKVAIKPIRVAGHAHPESKAGDPNVFPMKIPIRRGNSGGPILDRAGRVLGVVFAKINTPRVYAKTGRLIRDVGLGLRLPLLRQFLRPLGVEMGTTRDDRVLTAQEQFERGYQFIAQIGCWR